MSRPGEVTRVRKVASVIWQHDSAIPPSGRFLRKRSMRPSCKKTWVELLVLYRAPPTIKSGVGMIGSDFVSYLTRRQLPAVGVLQAGRPVAFTLPCRQSLAVRGVADWSACRIHSAMPPTACCQGCRKLVGPSRPLCHAASHAVALLASRY
ncbi:hypothetical protein B296_00037281 [Ensete ventricosum]|uniref:Uncharacterized protein n=1 Tax=Ensete ventricosum TaxID=4639 RepID=A0A426YPM5_ENSVE|nr:hypothetical protein B296_00037281 [Ensete ventricosum]